MAASQHLERLGLGLAICSPIAIATRRLAASAGGSAGTRQQLIDQAARAYDREPSIQGRTSRAAFIDGVLKIAHETPLGASERESYAASATTNRAVLIRSLVQEYERERVLQSIHRSSRAYVDSFLINVGLDRLADAEAKGL
jgi:hypothetical protein